MLEGAIEMIGVADYRLTFRRKAGSDEHPYGLLADQRLSGIFRFPPETGHRCSLNLTAPSHHLIFRTRDTFEPN